MHTEVEIEGNKFDIDQQAKDYAYNNAQPEIIRREIVMTHNNWTINTWDNFTQRYSNVKVWRRGRVIRFKGTQKEFNELHDELISDDSNGKVIGIHNEWSEPEPTKAPKFVPVYRIKVKRQRAGLADFAIQKQFDNEPNRQDVLEFLLSRGWGYDDSQHDFEYELM